MKKIYMTFVLFFFGINSVFAAPTRPLGASEVKDGITKGLESGGGQAGLSLGSVFGWLKDQLYTITFVIAVGALVYVGIRMVFSLGKPEEFKKAWVHFIYIIIGIFLVFAAYWIVTLVLSLSQGFVS